LLVLVALASGERSESHAQERRHQTGDDQNPQEDHQSGRESGGGHADQPRTRQLFLSGEHHRRRVVVVEREGQVAGGDDPDDAIQPHLLLRVGFDGPAHAPLVSGAAAVQVRFDRERRRRWRPVRALRGAVRQLENPVHAQMVGIRALVGALVPADLDRALEVDLHAVGKLERLEVGVGQDGSASAEVFDLGEARHELGASDATLLVDQLDGGALAVVRHAVAHQHVELAVVVFDGQHHRHGLADLDEAGDLAGPGTFAHLDLHPAADVVSGEVRPHHVQHVHGEGTERHGFLVLVVPSTTQFPRLVPHFLHLRVVLDHYDVLEVGTRTGLRAVPVQTIFGVPRGTTRVDPDLEMCGRPAQTGRKVDTMDITVVTLAEDNPVEGFVKTDVHLHQVLLALDVERDDLGHVWNRRGPDIAAATSRAILVHRLFGWGRRWPVVRVLVVIDRLFVLLEEGFVREVLVVSRGEIDPSSGWSVVGELLGRLVLLAQRLQRQLVRIGVVVVVAVLFDLFGSGDRFDHFDVFAEDGQLERQSE
jgi:hypothetical protein